MAGLDDQYRTPQALFVVVAEDDAVQSTRAYTTEGPPRLSAAWLAPPLVAAGAVLAVVCLSVCLSLFVSTNTR